MKLARIGSCVFVGLALVGAMMPITERDALADRPAESPRAAMVRGATSLETSSLAANPNTANPGANPGTGSGACAAGMIEVEGDYCPNVEQRCIKWIDPENVFPRRCGEFAPGTGTCLGTTVKKHFCIDRFEYPNKQGEKPIVMKSWNEAQDACKADGKRLCGDSEWTLACEGQERLPYPYGNKRDATACNIDKPHPDVNEQALADHNPERRAAEVARLWQGEASGTRAACVSPFGVMDMTGNVDEWVMNESGHPHKSGSKGGYWGPVRDRCRPMTTVHGEDFAFYQLGFRCCGDASGAATTKAPAKSNGTRTNTNTNSGNTKARTLAHR